MFHSYIFLSGKSYPNPQEIYNALGLCAAISVKPEIIVDSSLLENESILTLEEKLIFPTGQSARDYTFNTIEALNRIPLNREILVVTTGTTDTINEYIKNRVNSTQEKSIHWNILSSGYARYSLLEKQRTLSDYIPADTRIWLQCLVRKYGMSEILRWSHASSKQRILIIGESIIDGYIFCDALGRVTKDPLLAFLVKDKVFHLGGVLAAGKHFAGLGMQTTILSELGTSEQNLIKQNYSPSEQIQFLLDSEHESIIKTRYVEQMNNSRVFETYSLPSNYNNSSFNLRLERYLKENNAEINQIVIMDYGHDLISNKTIEIILGSQIPISVNAQSNAGNRGFNSISRYKGANFAYLNGSELQLEIRNKSIGLEDVVEKFAKSLDFKEVYITNGSRGILSWSKDEGKLVAPAFAPQIVDRTGAGDATLAVISALRTKGAPVEIAGFYGNIAGALLVSTIGNEVTVSAELLKKEATEILRKVSEQ